jgi:hypothetical protein
MPRSKTGSKKAGTSRSATKTETEGKTSELMRLCKWAKKNGAVQIKAHGIEILFPPPDLETPPVSPAARLKHDLPPNLEYLRERAVEAASTQKAPPAVRSRQDDPDIFAQDSDSWANQTRLPRR